MKNQEVLCGLMKTFLSPDKLMSLYIFDYYLANVHANLNLWTCHTFKLVLSPYCNSECQLHSDFIHVD